jgi:hypothetical protein
MMALKEIKNKKKYIERLKSNVVVCFLFKIKHVKFVIQITANICFVRLTFMFIQYLNNELIAPKG